VIISEQCSQTIIPIIQDISQISHVYIFCENNLLFEKWSEEWPKLPGVYKDITQICETLKQDIRHYDHNTVSISFVKKTDGAVN
jgi:hypothetical protein